VTESAVFRPVRQAVLLAGLLVAAFAARADLRVSTETLQLSFADNGSLQIAVACYPACQAEGVNIQQFGDRDVVAFDGQPASGWRLERQGGGAQIQLHFSHPSGAFVHWDIPERGHRLGLKVAGADQLRLASGESFRPPPAAGFGTWLEASRYVSFFEGDVRQAGYEETDVTELEADRWVGYRNRFWALLADAQGSRVVGVDTAEVQYDARLGMPIENEFTSSVYLGPIEPERLKQADPSLSKLLFAGLWFWLRWICFGLFYLLGFIQTVIPSTGLAIMVLSLLVGILMLPLSRIADRLQTQVHETEARLAPRMAEIKKNYKGEQQSAKILELYKEEKVHPLYSLKSLMGVAVVIPVFIGAFDMLAENIRLLHVGFLWISDLSKPDALFTLPFHLPFFGADVNLLPFLMTALSVWASALHNPPAMDPGLRKKQLRNMVLMAIGFFALFYTFPAGMVLYWTTNNLISVVKSLWARR
jgi:YidC/Oxa1 family membrane protein insertase